MLPPTVLRPQALHLPRLQDGPLGGQVQRRVRRNVILQNIQLQVGHWVRLTSTSGVLNLLRTSTNLKLEHPVEAEEKALF